MTSLIIDNGSRYKQDLEKLLAKYNPKITRFGDADITKIPSDSFVVLSGGHTIPVLWHNREFANEAEIIKNHPGPILGVCLGAQLIAHVYESHLHLLNERRKGLLEIRASKGTSLLKTEESVRVYENHNWSIKTLGASLVPLAESKDGIEIFKHKSKPIYGFQFHPEYINGGAGKLVFERVISTLTV